MIRYTETNDGQWFKITYAEQCPYEHMLGDQCQGIKGHEGDHWYYDNRGGYCWHINGEASDPMDIVSGMTPPDHKKWISPVDMIDKYYLRNFVYEQATDPDLIKRLENDDIRDDEMVDRPIK